MTKNDLKSFRDSYFEIESVREQERELRETMDGLKGMRIDSGRSGGGRKHSATEEAIVKLESIQNLYYRKLSAYYATQLKIEKGLKVLDPIEATVIRAYYFRRNTFQEVAKLIGYEKRNVERLHKKALEKLAAYQ